MVMAMVMTAPLFLLALLPAPAISEQVEIAMMVMQTATQVQLSFVMEPITIAIVQAMKILLT